MPGDRGAPDGVAARVVALLAALVLLGVPAGCADGGEQTGPGTSSAATTPSPAPSGSTPAGTGGGADGGAEPLLLGVPDGGATRCAPPSAAVLRSQEVALRGVVTEVGPDVVRIEVRHWYRGAPVDVVELAALPEELHGLLLAPNLEVGTAYLVSATGGELSLCGYSGPDIASRRAMYERAFADSL